jgi:hypothetical protein
MTIFRLRLPALLVPLAIQDLDGGLCFALSSSLRCSGDKALFLMVAMLYDLC